jgi:hypothetical protein
LCRSINGFKKCYRSRTNFIKDDDDLLVDFHRILKRWMNYFWHLLKLLGLNDIRQTEIHTVEPFVFETNSFEVEVAVEKLR